MSTMNGIAKLRKGEDQANRFDEHHFFCLFLLGLMSLSRILRCKKIPNDDKPRKRVDNY